MRNGFRFFPLFLGFLGFLQGCGGSYSLQMQTPDLNRNPKLAVQMQEVRVDEETVLYQEQGDGIYDTLILYKAFNPETSLSAYVQKSINQLKIQGTKLTKEQTKKTEL